MAVNIISVRRLIPDVEQSYHFDDETLQEWIDDYLQAGKEELTVKYYVARRALVAWIKELKLTDVDVKQNSLALGTTGASKEKLLDLLNASITELEEELKDMEEPYFNVVTPAQILKNDMEVEYGI